MDVRIILNCLFLVEIGHITARAQQPQTSRAPPSFSQQLWPFTTMQGSLFRPALVAVRRMAVRRVVARSYTLQQPDAESYEVVDPVPDYPQLPWRSRQNFSAKGWDDMLLRRNYGDPVRRTPAPAFTTFAY